MCIRDRCIPPPPLLKKGGLSVNELQIFNHPVFGKVRTVEVNGDPWLAGKDVAEALGYSNPHDALRRHVDDEDKGLVKYETLGGAREMIIINESGLYSLVMSSRLSCAKKLRRWVTSEVLPSIRKNGGYIHGQDDMTPEELIAKAAMLAQEILDRREARIAAIKRR